VFGLDFWLASKSQGSAAQLTGAVQFLLSPANWRIVVDLFALALAGGIYCVPLYALMQVRSETAHRARVIAANNIMNALFMVVAGIASALMLAAGLGIPSIFLAIGIGNVAVAAAMWKTAR
jgi:hypothetical protein